MSDYRLLIISNNCLSQHNSNGRTLLNMFSGFKRDNLYQIYTSGEYTDNKYCAESYRLTNRDVINSYIGIVPSNTQSILSSTNESKELSKKKNAVTMLLRDLAWDCSIKLRKCILSWTRAKQPDAIVLQLGDSTHLIHIAVFLTKKLNIPLITYNTEDYYFKNYNYMKQSKKADVLYRIFHQRFCRKFREMMKLNPKCIYNCEGLRDIYDKEFETSSDVIFCSTNMKSVKNVNNSGQILYAGNLGIGRHISLMKIGVTLQEMDSSLFLDVYGNATDDVKVALNSAKGIRYHGFVSYEENCKSIEKSKLLIHVEGFDEYFSKDTKYAFSTKIADYCASGIPIFMYAPEWCESTKYAINHDFAFVVSENAELKQQLQLALEDTELRCQKVKNAIYIADLNHHMDRNKRKLIEIIENLCCVK